MQCSALDDECLWAVHLGARFLPLGPRTIFPSEAPSCHNYCQSAFAGTGTGTGGVTGNGRIIINMAITIIILSSLLFFQGIGSATILVSSYSCALNAALAMPQFGDNVSTCRDCLHLIVIHYSFPGEEMLQTKLLSS